ncbi:MAG: TIM barrel protein [bacterium]|nr:TIM barrel protein [bacterium]
MELNRRSFIQSTGMTLAAASVAQTLTQAAGDEFKIGMCDWNLGGSCKPELFPRAKEANLKGVQVSVGTNPENIPLREKSVREEYLKMCEENGLKVCSVAAGSILNEIPLKSEPESAVYVIDAVEAAAALGADNILIAFFGDGDLMLRDARERTRNISEGKYKEFELDSQAVERVVAVMKQIAPRAKDHGVYLGLENTITAKQNMEIIDRIGSDMVKVFYDVGNSTGNGYNVPEELRMLGNDMICEIHLKDWKTPYFPSGEGMVDFAAIAQACKDIGYDKWYVLETSGRDKKFIEDTHDNIEFARKLFA